MGKLRVFKVKFRKMVEIINMIKIIIEYLCQNFAKTQKNNMNSNLIFIAMNGQFSLR